MHHCHSATSNAPHRLVAMAISAMLLTLVACTQETKHSPINGVGVGPNPALPQPKKSIIPVPVSYTHLTLPTKA